MVRGFRFVLLAAMLLACAAAGPARAASTPTLDSLRVVRARALKAPSAESFQRWLAVAEAARGLLPMPEERDRPGGQVSSAQKKQNDVALPILDEALAHVGPPGAAALAAALPDPIVSAAMVQALIAQKRTDEAAAECRDALGRWGAADAPRVVEACRDCRGSGPSWGGGGASHSVFRPWIDESGRGDAGAPSTGSWAYRAGMVRGLPNTELLRRIILSSMPPEAAWLPQVAGALSRREAFGVIVADPAGRRGASMQAIAASLQVPFVALGEPPEPGTPLLPGVPPGARTIRVRPGPEALARRLAAAAKRQGARLVAIALPDEGGSRRLAEALARVARESSLQTVALDYPAGRRNRAADAARLRALGADAVALLGPGEESADWLIALRAGGGPLLVVGTDELDPDGLHDAERRAAEGAIYVRTDFAPNDTLPEVADGAADSVRTGPAFDSNAAGLYVAGWLLGDAIAHGADTPAALERAMRAHVAEGDASDAWLAVPASVARIEVMRIKGGRAEPLP